MVEGADAYETLRNWVRIEARRKHVNQDGAYTAAELLHIASSRDNVLIR